MQTLPQQNEGIWKLRDFDRMIKRGEGKMLIEETGFCKLNFVPDGISKYILKRKKERKRKSWYENMFLLSKSCNSWQTGWERLEEVQQEIPTQDANICSF